MNPLSPEASRLFQLARHDDEPVAATLRRVEGSLTRRIAQGAAVATIGTVTAKAGATAVSALPWLKLVTSLSLALTFTGVGWWGVQRMTQTSEHQASARPRIGSASVATHARAEPAAPSELPVAPQPSIETVPIVSARNAPKTRAAPSASVTAAAPASAEDPLHAEIRELRTAQQALRVGDGARVLALLNGQDTVYSAGSLQEERAAARVLALCQVGRTSEARSLAQRFEQRWPSSPLVARIRNSCWQP